MVCSLDVNEAVDEAAGETIFDSMDVVEDGSTDEVVVEEDLKARQTLEELSTDVTEVDTLSEDEED